MSWFRYALNITTVYNDSYYTAIDPGEFYEWKLHGFIPKERVFTKRLPPSDIFTRGLVIATARIPREFLDKSDFGYTTNRNINADIFVQAGQIQTPKELIDRYYRIRQNFNHSIEKIKDNSSTRSYFISDGTLYKIVQSNNQAKILNYGLIKDLLEKLSQVQKQLSKQSAQKKGRSYEMEDFLRFENAILFIKNDHIPVDSSKIDILLRISKIDPVSSYDASWEDCLLKTSQSAKQLKDLLDRYESLNWVKLIKD